MLYRALFVGMLIVAGLPTLQRPANAAEPVVLPTVEEARRQAALLHETMHGTLQVVHHEYYREDEGLTIPAATLKEVFAELAKRQKVELRWLAVDGQAMNVDHVAKSDFEKEAVQALASGKATHEGIGENVFRYAGAITLTSDCLKCHLPNRTSNKDRTAGLVVEIPVRAK